WAPGPQPRRYLPGARWPRSFLLGELFGAVLLLQCLDELIEVSVDHLRQAIERQVDAVVGYATLWKVVRADALGAVAGADLELARLRLRGLLPFPFGREQARFQKRHR